MTRLSVKCFRVDENKWKIFGNFAESFGKNKSELIRESIDSYVSGNGRIIGYEIPKIFESERQGLGILIIGDKCTGKTVLHSNLVRIYGSDGDVVVTSAGLDEIDTRKYKEAGAVVVKGDGRYSEFPEELRNPYIGFEDTTRVDDFIIDIAADARHSDLESGRGKRDFGVIVHMWKIAAEIMPYIDVIVVMKSGSFVSNAFKHEEDVKMFSYAKKLAKGLPQYHYFVIDRRFKAISGYIKNDDVSLLEKRIKGDATIDDFEYTHFTGQINGDGAKGEAISAGMKRYHNKRKQQRISSGNLCDRDKYVIAIKELSNRGLSYDKITGKVVVEYIEENLDDEFQYTLNKSREISKVKKRLLNGNSRN